MKLGIEVAKRRRKAGLTQAELARLACTTQTVISRIESGRATPTISTLERVAQATGEPLKLVLGETPKTLPREEKRQRVRQVLGDFVFDPWEREPSDAEARSLTADGLGQEHFARR